MFSDSAYWVWLQKGIGIGKRTDHILSAVDDIRDLYEKGDEYRKSLGIFEPVQLERLKAYDISSAQEIVNIARLKNRSIIYPKLSSFPDLLKNIAACPIVLYVLGNADILNNSLCISFVGTRAASEACVDVTSRLCYSLAKANVTIVSGGALGIDNAAHYGTIAANGRTVLVEASGFSEKLPRHRASLVEKIIDNGGAVVTEYPAKSITFKWNFLVRNRLISGLSEATVVAEAGERSGALNTAESARKQGRKIFVIPGNITDKNQVGIQKLIKKSAELVFTPADIVEPFVEKYADVLYTKRIENTLPPQIIDPYDVPTKLEINLFEDTDTKKDENKPVKKPKTKEKPIDISMLSRQEIDILNFCATEKTVDEISVHFDIPISALSAILLNMQLTGHIVYVAGNKYKINENGR